MFFWSQQGFRGAVFERIYSGIKRGTLRRNFDIPVGRATCETYSATWNFDNNSVFVLKSKKTTVALRIVRGDVKETQCPEV
jgi:hypothetical protein